MYAPIEDQKLTTYVTCPLANQRLYGEGVPDRHDAVVDVVLVVQDVRIGVKGLPDTVPAWRKRVDTKARDDATRVTPCVNG